MPREVQVPPFAMFHTRVNGVVEGWQFGSPTATMLVGRRFLPPDALLADQAQTCIFEGVAVVIARTP